MRLIITNVEKKDDHIYVTGETAVGNIKGKWCGRESPILGEVYEKFLESEMILKTKTGMEI